MKMIAKIFTSVLIVGYLSSCASVAPYQMMYLNDEDMELGKDGLASFENAFQSYREGATGGTTGKTGGGCGCN